MDNIILVSVVSYWEIAIKKALGRIDTDVNLATLVEASGFAWLNIELQHIDNIANLPFIHHDPFDRLLIAQSIAENAKILTHDNKILQYATGS